MHTYWPKLTGDVLGMVKVESEPFCCTVVPEKGDSKMGVPSCSHWKEGGGSPLAWQWRENEEPSSTVTLGGWEVMAGERAVRV